MNLGQKTIFYILIMIIAMWVLTPIFFITIASFTPKDEIYAWPKPITPSKFLAETLIFFLKSYGIIHSLLNSIIVAI